MGVNLKMNPRGHRKTIMVVSKLKIKVPELSGIVVISS